MKILRKLLVRVRGEFSCTSFEEFGRSSEGVSVRPIRRNFVESLFRRSPGSYLRIHFDSAIATLDGGPFVVTGIPKITFRGELGLSVVEAEVVGQLIHNDTTDEGLSSIIAALKSPISFLVTDNGNRYLFSCTTKCEVDVHTILDRNLTISGPNSGADNAEIPWGEHNLQRKRQIDDLRVEGAANNEAKPFREESASGIIEPITRLRFDELCVLVSCEVALISDSWAHRYFVQRFGDGPGRELLQEFKDFLDADEYYYDLVKFRSNVAGVISRYTYRWTGNTHVLPISRVGEFDNKRDYLVRELEFLKKNFVESYENGLRRNNADHGGWGARHAFPSSDFLRGEIDLFIAYFPVPTTDFPSRLSPSQVFVLDNVRSLEFDRLSTRVSVEYKNDLLDNLKRVCGSLEENDNRTRRRKIYESTVNRLIELAELEASFNFVRSDQLVKSCEAIRRVFHGIDVSGLRSEPMIRADVRRHLMQALKYLEN